jgi:hypothetical protein
MAQQPAREGRPVGGAVDVRFGQVGVARVGLACADPTSILRDLTERVAEAPGFFRRTASVLDLSVLVRKVPGGHPKSPTCGRLKIPHP